MIATDAAAQISAAVQRLESLATRLAAARANLRRSEAQSNHSRWYLPELLWPTILKDRK